MLMIKKSGGIGDSKNAERNVQAQEEEYATEHESRLLDLLDCERSENQCSSLPGIDLFFLISHAPFRSSLGHAIAATHHSRTNESFHLTSSRLYGVTRCT
jgi:hypothetical protein